MSNGVSGIAGGGGSSMSVLSSFGQALQGNAMAQAGTDMQVQGAEFNAAVYRQAGQAALAEANYNIQLNQVETARQSDAISRQFISQNSHNQALMGSNGVLASSKSYLAVVDANMSNFERQQLQLSHTSLAARNGLLYEGQLAQTADENAARAADYQAQVAQYMGDLQQSQNMSKIFQNGFSAMGSMFGGM